KPLAVAGGGQHSLALLEGGTVWAWGDNGSGQLGNAAAASSSAVPVQVDKLSGIVAISTKASHNLALDAAGKVWAWGNGGWGALGDGTTNNRAVPFAVPGLPRIVAIEAGNAVSVAVGGDGSVWMWGDNTFGQFGESRYVRQLSPVKVDALAGYTGFSVGEQHVLARDPGGVIRAWGWNSYGQLGVGDVADRSAPSAVTGLPDVQQWSARAGHSIALAADGTVWAWGSNGNGESADQTVAATNLPIAVSAGGKFVALSAGSFHSLALGDDGSAWAWGGNNNGALGDNTQRDNFLPRRVGGLPKLSAIAAGSEFSLALDAGGAVWSWGSQDSGRLGNGYSSGVQLKPQALKALSSVTAISAGYQHALALRDDGTVWAWGANDSGQLGDGTTTSRSAPVPVSRLKDIVAVAAGDFHSLALDRGGQVWAWGYNISGQLGDGTTTDRLVPVQVAGLDHAVAISAGDRSGYALTQDGRIWSWGLNEEGQLGSAASADKLPKATPIADVDAFLGVSARSGYALALRKDGTVWGWGRNFEGQLGDATFAQRDTPVVSLDTGGESALDLDPAIANVIPASKLPPLRTHASRSGDLSRLNLSVEIKPGTLNVGGLVTRHGFASACGPCEIYVAALYNDMLLLSDEKRNWVTPLPEQIKNNALPAFLRGVQVSSQTKLTVDILQQVDVSGFPGARILVGYGSSVQEMLGAGRYYPVFTVPRNTP
ncbi:MAG: hypothetical protein KGZ83_04530, partial [Sulfuricella sp.]|nr:hypothetical protein [Sulfuricella sp.]